MLGLARGPSRTEQTPHGALTRSTSVLAKGRRLQSCPTCHLGRRLTPSQSRFELFLFQNIRSYGHTDCRRRLLAPSRRFGGCGPQRPESRFAAAAAADGASSSPPGPVARSSLRARTNSNLGVDSRRFPSFMQNQNRKEKYLHTHSAGRRFHSRSLFFCGAMYPDCYVHTPPSPSP